MALFVITRTLPMPLPRKEKVSPTLTVKKKKDGLLMKNKVMDSELCATYS